MNLPRLVLAPLLAWLALGISSSFAIESRSPSAFAIETVRAALADGAATGASTVAREAANVRSTLRRNLDMRLASRATVVSGSDTLIGSGTSGATRHLGLLVLEYPSPAIANRMIPVLAPLNGYFRRSKILVRFAAVAAGNAVVVAFTENSGDERMVAAIEQLPAAFNHASQNLSIEWREKPSGAHTP